MNACCQSELPYDCTLMTFVMIRLEHIFVKKVELELALAKHLSPLDLVHILQTSLVI